MGKMLQTVLLLGKERVAKFAGCGIVPAEYIL
jgi:hypothetical protein